MPDVREKQREARRKIIRQWAKLPKDKRQSMEGISEIRQDRRSAERESIHPQSSRSA